MIDIFVLLCILSAVVFLIIMSLIDLKHFILPDELNFGLAVCGVTFHVLTAYYFNNITGMVVGAFLGGGFLYTIRFFANRHYGRDTLGLGDVKLLAAAGIWLGAEGVFQAITIGAAAGLVHGLVYASYISYKHKTKFAITQLVIPAGPGFAIGIVITGFIMFDNYVMEIIHDIFS